MSQIQLPYYFHLTLVWSLVTILMNKPILIYFYSIDTLLTHDYYQLKSTMYSELLSFLPNVSIQFQDPIQGTTIYLFVTFPWVPLGGDIFRLFLFLMTLVIVRSTGQIFCKITLKLNSSDVFLVIRLWRWVLAGKIIEAK